jgi:hypothetical protein
LFGLFAASGIIFLPLEGGRDNRTRMKRKNTLDNGEEDFCASLAAQPALARLELPDTFAEK